MTTPQMPSDSSTPSEPPPSRRRFLGWLSRAFLGLWGLGGAAVIGAYLKPPEHTMRVAERMVRVGLLDDLRIGEARLIRHDVTPFYLVRLDATRLTAISAVCTHVRCILGYDRERGGLVCPCHDGRFDLAGNVLSGPPPRSLPTYNVSVRAGEVYVHL